ncbi:MAG: hypothetical protein AAFX05_09230 [Planctomycetota bacterium]
MEKISAHAGRVDAAWQLSRSVGVPTRGLTPGPEEELLNDFLGEAVFKIDRGCIATVFREPQLECGTPDAVITVWRPSVATGWPDERSLLTEKDYQFLQFLHYVDEIDVELARTRLGRGFGSRLDRLEAAGVVIRRGDRWRARSLRSTFAVTRVIAIEAKMRDWRRALAQCHRNSWFASDLWMLLPDGGSLDSVWGSASLQGIEVLSPDEGVLDLRGRGELYPRSYASWMLNDWSWRRWRQRERDKIKQ